MSKRVRDTFVHVLLSFALGGLLGDVFFHTLPHMAEAGQHDHHHHEATHAHSHDGDSRESDHQHHHHHHHNESDHHHHHSEKAILLNLYIVLGIWVFFLIDRITHEYFGGSGDTHCHGEKKVSRETAADAEKQLRFKKFAVISMIGDFVHNFTDGLSIGVSYLVDYKIGVVTTIAMLFHEIPHEVGDFAILFQLNYSLLQIVLVQCLTGGGALAGSIVGYYVG